MLRSQRSAACAAFMAVMLVSLSAWSQQGAAQEDEGQAQQAPGAGKDPYQGVTPEGGQPPNVPAPPPGFQNVTWIGFKQGAQGSEVFLQLSGPVAYKEKQKGSRVLITLDKVKVPLKNNLRPVVTRSFPGTPVARFQLRRLARGQAQLEISLRRPSTPVVELRTHGQFTYLIVRFSPAAELSD